ncbi:MAG TPA: hypothetical protein VK703_13305 [Candidatus Acidoferrales bacterium]|nr:hypothetical protein [Candidatus Acidoferrales bacterium]
MGACVCLIAAVLLWSPLWAVAWQSAQMSCCDSGICLTADHAKQHHGSAPGASQKPVTCEHQGGNEISQCAIHCYQTEFHVFVASIVFVLPIAPVPARSPYFVTPVALSAQREILPSVAPPDRPPRLIPS